MYSVPESIASTSLWSRNFQHFYDHRNVRHITKQWIKLLSRFAKKKKTTERAYCFNVTTIAKSLKATGSFIILHNSACWQDNFPPPQKETRLSNTKRASCGIIHEEISRPCARAAINQHSHLGIRFLSRELSPSTHPCLQFCDVLMFRFCFFFLTGKKANHSNDKQPANRLRPELWQIELDQHYPIRYEITPRGGSVVRLWPSLFSLRWKESFPNGPVCVQVVYSRKKNIVDKQ